MKAVPTFALMVLACSAEPAESTSVGSAAEALRQLEEREVGDVARCRSKASFCAADAGGALGPLCERISNHCEALAGELADARAEIADCLEEAAACEQTASTAADCEAARALCAPADRDFRGRRDRTLNCSSQAEQCLGSVATEADAGGLVCDDDARDFVGCCRGKHGTGGDAGVRDERRDDSERGFGFRPRRERDHDRDRGGDVADGGAPRRRF